jgi:hypothetical protein
MDFEIVKKNAKVAFHKDNIGATIGASLCTLIFASGLFSAIGTIAVGGLVGKFAHDQLKKRK